MERKYQKYAWFAHDMSNAILATEFETLKQFFDYAKNNKMTPCYCPMNHCSTMVGNYKLLKLN